MPSAIGRANPRTSTYPTAWRLAALAVAVVALLAELAAPSAVRALPYGPLWVNAAIVLGLLALLLVLFEGADRALGDRLFILLVPYVASGVLARLLYMDPGASQGVVLREAAVPEGLAIGAGLGLAWLALHWAGARRGRALAAVTGAGWVLAVGLVGAHVWLAAPVGPGPAIVLALTLVFVGACLAVQRLLARRGRTRRVRVLASGTALAVAGGQLLDGVVSYLAVVDPFGLLPVNASEGVLLSRALLSTAGPVFPLAKWALAAGAVAMVEPTDEDAEMPWWPRFAVLVLVLFAGLGPGLFSALQLL